MTIFINRILSRLLDSYARKCCPLGISMASNAPLGGSPAFVPGYNYFVHKSKGVFKLWRRTLADYTDLT